MSKKIICNKCNGKGLISINLLSGKMLCPKCKGNKELDWLESIFGVFSNSKQDGIMFYRLSLENSCKNIFKTKFNKRNNRKDVKKYV